MLVLLPAVSLGELQAARTVGIRSLLTSGAVGVMNARTGPATAGRARRAIDSLVKHPEEIRPTSLEAACVTIGAGTRCSARDEGGLAFEAQESVEGVSTADLWAQRTGRRPGSDRIYQTAIVRIQARHAGLRYRAIPGALGQALRQAGMPTAVVGNADDPGGPQREAACIVMDDLGRVPLGAVGASLSVHDPLVPGGRRTNPEAVLRAVEGSVRAGARLVVVETGDTARVDRARNDIQADVRPLRRLEAIERADRVVAGLLARLDRASTLLILLAPAPSLDAAREGNSLPPVIMAGRWVERGLISSPSTRTPGLAVLTDIAPTVLGFLRVPIPPQMVGRPLTSRPGAYAAERALALEAGFQRIDDYARPVARWLVWAQIALFGVFFFLAWVRPAPLAGDPRRVRVAALALAALPASLLLVGLLAPTSSALGALCLVLLVAALACGAAVAGPWLSGPGILWLGAAGLLAYDIVAGGRLLQGSPLGYSPYSGARYYGIGNEGFGLLLPAAVLGVVLTAAARRQTAEGSGQKARGRRQEAGGEGREMAPLWWAAGLAMGAAALIGHPSLGANFGGGLSAAVTGIALAALAVPRGSRGRVLLRAALLGVAIGALPIAADLLRGGGSQSHVGRAVEVIVTGGVGEAWLIILRKLQMNWSLLRHSPWSRLLVASSIAFALLFRRGGPRLQPVIRRALLGVLVGAAAALALNDSGVLPAAEMVVAATAALAYLTADARPAPAT